MASLDIPNEDKHPDATKPWMDGKSSEIRQKTARGLLIAMVQQTSKIMTDRTVLGPEEVTLFDNWLQDLLDYIKSLQNREASIAYVDPAQYVEQQIRQTVTNKEKEVAGKIGDGSS